MQSQLSRKWHCYATAESKHAPPGINATGFVDIYSGAVSNGLCYASYGASFNNQSNMH